MGVSLLSRLGFVGIAKETTPGTYVAPTAYLPCTNIAFEDMYGDLRDESYRNNDSVLQGLYQGVGDGAGSFDMAAYPDLVGHFFRGMVGPDTVTAAAVSTTLSGSTIVGASTFTVGSATGITANQVLQLDVGANAEYVKVGAGYTTGTSIPTTTPLTLAHSSGVAIVSQTTHTFKQTNTRQPAYSLTEFTPASTRGWAGSVLEELDVKIDPKGILNLSTKWQSFPSAVQSTPTYAGTKANPFLGWQWAMTNGGASSNRGITLDLAIKREVEGIHASTGTQAPEEVFPGALSLDCTYKARFDSETDLALFLGQIQQPVTAVITQPTTATQMGAVLTITSSVGSFYKGKKNLGNKYIDADFSIAGIANSTDGGTLQVVLQNFTTTQY